MNHFLSVFLRKYDLPRPVFNGKVLESLGQMSGFVNQPTIGDIQLKAD